MKNAQLIRCSVEAECIRGVLLMEGEPVCVTLELPWKENEAGKSCIPPGTYHCQRRAARSNITGGKGQAFEVEKVPGREGVLIHVANTPQQLRGCIAVGRAFDKGRFGEPMISDSRVAFDKLFRAVAGDSEFQITISDVHRRGYPKPEPKPKQETPTCKSAKAPQSSKAGR
jgi:hypothetical protein